MSKDFTYRKFNEEYKEVLPEIRVHTEGVYSIVSVNVSFDKIETNDDNKTIYIYTSNTGKSYVGKHKFIKGYSVKILTKESFNDNVNFSLYDPVNKVTLFDTSFYIRFNFPFYRDCCNPDSNSDSGSDSDCCSD